MCRHRYTHTHTHTQANYSKITFCSDLAAHQETLIWWVLLHMLFVCKQRHVFPSPFLHGRGEHLAGFKEVFEYWETQLLKCKAGPMCRCWHNLAFLYAVSCEVMQIKCLGSGFPLQCWKLPFKWKRTRKNISKELGNLKIRKMQIGAQAYVCAGTGQESEWVLGDCTLFNESNFFSNWATLIYDPGTSLAGQWLRLCLPVQRSEFYPWWLGS